MGRTIIILITVLATVFILGACARPAVSPTPAESVTFADTKLEAAIREAIHKPEGSIHMSDLESLTTLSADRRHIADLHGLDFCSNLIELNLSHNQISDVSPLASLSNLTELNLKFNQISDVSSLASLTNLTELILERNQISDVSSLAPLTKLTELNLRWNNEISDISPLASLPRLHRLTIGNNPLSPASIDIHIPQLEERVVNVYW